MSIIEKEIPELTWVDRLNDSLHDYYLETGVLLNNVSHWDSCDDYCEKLFKRIRLNGWHSNFNYILDSKTNNTPAMRKLGFDESVSQSIVTPSGTTSIELVASVLSSNGFKNVQVVGPVYYTVPYSFKKVGCDVTITKLKKKNGYTFLISENDTNFDAIWITNPIFSTSEYANSSLLDYIEDKLKSGTTVVCDESLSCDERYIGRRFCKYENFIGIYNPLKKLGINSIKFSVIIFNKSLKRSFQHWSNIVYGGLPESCLIGLNFFESNNYSSVLELSTEYCASSYNSIHDVLITVPNVCLDVYNYTQYTTCYITCIDNIDLHTVEECMELSKCVSSSFIPNLRNHFSSSDYFSFRINLSRIGRHNLGDVVRLASTLAMHGKGVEKRCTSTIGDYHIEKVCKANWRDGREVELFDGQEQYVWSVSDSIARAFIKPNDKEIQPYNVYWDGRIRGFFFLEFTTRFSDMVCIGGLQLDKSVQRQQHGRKLSRAIRGLIKIEFPYCKVLKIVINTDNHISKNLMTKAGFRATGRCYGDEVEYYLDI